jgi:tetratricopeptide (TPR) repeat protein
VFSHNRHKWMLAKSATLVAISSILSVAGAQAAGVTHSPMVLTAYVNGAGGESILAGKLDEALAQIEKARTPTSVEYTAKMNNLCVIYTAKKQLEEAARACNSALKLAKYDRITSQRYAPGSSRENAYVAIAYANRAVAHMMANDEARAKDDLARAKSLAPSADFVSKNVLAAQSPRSTIAKIEAAPSR